MGLEIGNEVNIAYCPERHNPGDPENQITNTSRIVGSMDSEVGKSLVNLYEKITQGDVKFVGEIEIAESSKLIENVQRDINIALVNELSMILPRLGIDIEDVLDAAETKWNFHRYTPGIGVGGHCIPVDPYFLIDKAHSINYDAQLISAARAINNEMPEYVNSEIIKILDSHNIFGSKRTVLILGWSYKPGIGDIRGSPSEQLARKLHENGIKVFCHDNYVNSSEIPDFVNYVGELSEITNIGLVALSTAHDEYVNLNWGELFTESENRIIFDGRRVLDMQSIIDSGWTIYAIGRPNDLV
jgi:nucleotide sugar dehydrogenase